MQLHQFSANKNQKSKKRIGRGGKRGTYCGRGLKGQKARAGRKLRPEWRDTLKHIPKHRGYRFKSKKARPTVLNLGRLNKFFKDGDLVTPAVLLRKGLIIKTQTQTEIKILGEGGLDKKLDFKGLAFSQSAKEKIIKAGGAVK